MTWLVLSAAALGSIVAIASTRAVIGLLAEVAQDRIDAEPDGPMDDNARELESSWHD